MKKRFITSKVCVIMGLILLLSSCNGNPTNGKIDPLQNDIKNISNDNLSSNELSSVEATQKDNSSSSQLTIESKSQKPEETTAKTENKEISSQTYTPSPKTPEKLPNEQELNIKKTYVNQFLKKDYPNAVTDDVQITKYAGMYNGAIAVIITDKFNQYMDVTFEDTIDDVIIYYNNYNKLVIWKSDIIYKLSTAFEQKIITKDNLVDIAYYKKKK
ncbi:MAG: hypothetical protein RR549_00650 [Oscillospiraceae bacterium]